MTGTSSINVSTIDTISRSLYRLHCLPRIEHYDDDDEDDFNFLRLPHFRDPSSRHPTIKLLLKKYKIHVTEAMKRLLPVVKWAEQTYTYCTFGFGSQFSPETFFRLHRAAHNFLRSGSRTLLGNWKNLQLELAELFLHNPTLHGFGIYYYSGVMCTHIRASILYTTYASYRYVFTIIRILPKTRMPKNY
jgi:hypothetical protein